MEQLAVVRGCRLLALLACGRTSSAKRQLKERVGHGDAEQGGEEAEQPQSRMFLGRQLEGGSRGGLADEHDEFPPLAGLQEGALDKPVARARAAPCAVPSSPSLGEARTDARAPV
jgi:hypothetical protein